MNIEEKISVESWKVLLEGQVFELEKGGPAMKLKRVGLMDLIEQGDIPDTLSGEALHLASEQLVGRKWEMEDLKNYMGVINLVVKACSVSPLVTENESPGSISVHRIPSVYRIGIFNWACEAVGPLRPFREKQNGGSEALQFVQNLQRFAEQVS